MENERLRKAWQVRKTNFRDDIYFYAPTIKRYETDEFSNFGEPYFVPVSITGSSCLLQCDHCKAKILKAMYEAKEPKRLFDLAKKLKAKGTKGLLVSGGSNQNGIVPLWGFMDVIRKIKEELGLKILVHTGLVDKDLAKGLAKAGIEAAMIDIIGSDQTITDVYHLNAKVANFEDSLKCLCEYGVKVAPHIVIGLHYGRINGEYKALEIISRYPIVCLVLVGLMPQPGTPMAEISPPTPEEMGEIFCCARITFPQIPVLLGCERAATEDKVRTEKLALKSGLNGIAYPTEEVMELARKLGLKPHFSKTCCALVFEELN